MTLALTLTFRKERRASLPLEERPELCRSPHSHPQDNRASRDQNASSSLVLPRQVSDEKFRECTHTPKLATKRPKKSPTKGSPNKASPGKSPSKSPAKAAHEGQEPAGGEALEVKEEKEESAFERLAKLGREAAQKRV